MYLLLCDKKLIVTRCTDYRTFLLLLVPECVRSRPAHADAICDWLRDE